MRSTASSTVTTSPVSNSWELSPGGDGAGVLHSQQGASLGVLPGAVQFPLGHLFPHLGELLHHGFNCFPGLARFDGAVDDERTAVAEVGDRAGDIVGQAPVFTQVEEKAAAGAVAEDTVEHGQGVAVGVGEGKAGQTEAKVGLVGGAAVDADLGGRRSLGHGFPIEGRAWPPGAGGRGYCVHGLAVGDAPGDGDDGVGGIVLAFHVGNDILEVDGVDGFDGAADVAAHGLVRPEGLVDEEVGKLGGVVVGGPQLFEDDLPLLFHLGGIHDRMLHHVKQDGEGLPVVGSGHLAPEDGHLPVGAGVHQAAHPLDGVADELGGGPVPAALEGQVLKEVGQAS